MTVTTLAIGASMAFNPCLIILFPLPKLRYINTHPHSLRRFKSMRLHSSLFQRHHRKLALCPIVIFVSKSCSHILPSIVMCKPDTVWNLRLPRIPRCNSCMVVRYKLASVKSRDHCCSGIFSLVDRLYWNDCMPSQRAWTDQWILRLPSENSQILIRLFWMRRVLRKASARSGNGENRTYEVCSAGCNPWRGGGRENILVQAPIHIT